MKIGNIKFIIYFNLNILNFLNILTTHIKCYFYSVYNASFKLKISQDINDI